MEKGLPFAKEIRIIIEIVFAVGFRSKRFRFYA